MRLGFVPYVPGWYMVTDDMKVNLFPPPFLGEGTGI